jgi:hypothetical protein
MTKITDAFGAFKATKPGVARVAHATKGTSPIAAREMPPRAMPPPAARDATDAARAPQTRARRPNATTRTLSTTTTRSRAMSANSRRSI